MYVRQPDNVFWQVSHKVPSKTIQGFTKSCLREDCKLSVRVAETTLKSVSDHYNKDGQLIINDTNRFTADIFCATCQKGYIVDQDGKIQ